jgi:hypothetical protein
MDVISSGPLRATSVVWQPSAGRWALTVVCKATYRLEPIESPLAEAQEAPNEEDNFWDDDPARSLYAPSDLAPFKARADVLLVGHAFAPQGQPVRALVARLCVGEVDKSIEVWCDRAFGSDGRPLEGPRFKAMSLRYERAAGGPDTSNPIGMRFNAPPDMYGSFAIPNLQPLGTHVGWKGDTFAPIGFGPLAPSWPGRAEKLYRSAAGFPHARWFERPLPEGIDLAYFNAAPADQQVGALRPNERLVLENLHRDHARLVTSLPGVRPRAVAERGGGREEIQLVCDTLWIDSDRAICTLVWRGRIGLRDRREAGQILVSTEGSSAAVDESPAKVRPHARPGGAPSAPEVAGAAAHVGIAFLTNHFTDPTATLVPTPEEVARAKQAPATPFQEASPSGIHEHGPDYRAVAVTPPPRVDALRPGAPPQAGNAGQKPWTLLGIPQEQLNTPVNETITIVKEASQAPPTNALPFKREEAPSIPIMAPLSVEAFVKGALALISPPPQVEAPAKARAGGEPDAWKPPEPVLAPPMIGPLATPEMAMRSPPPPEVSAAKLLEAAKPEEPPAAEPDTPGRDPAQFELEKCASVSASIARRKDEALKILEVNGLSRGEWDVIERYWTDELRRETARGKTALMKRFDRAYVEQLERERGPIQAQEYAKIVVASERGAADEAMNELGLPQSSLMRVQRVWLDRRVQDASVDQQIREAVAQARVQ